MNFILSTKELADFFNLTEQAVRRWSQSGCPKLEKSMWDLKEVFDWWWDNIAQEKDMPADDTLAGAKKDYWLSKSEREKIMVAILKGTLVKKEEAEEQLISLIAVFKAGLFLFRDRMPPLLEGKNRIEIQREIKAEIKSIFDAITKTA